jgi:mannose-1-phosphate guanylyltransferase
MIIPVILSGGSGTRLWPLSRKLHPKQFFNLINDTTLFQDTILRLPEYIEDPLIICNEDHRFLVAEQLKQINKKSNGIILEPIGKNTAPAIALAAINSIKNNQDPILLILSADHLIEDLASFHKSIELATELADKNHLVTFGVTPVKPESGYGYIEIDSKTSKKYFNIKSFTEKPNVQKAKQYIELGNYFWNSGIFMFKASKYLSELEKYEPEIFFNCKKSLGNEYLDNEFIRLDNEIFSQCASKSIDYAVMERTKNAIVVPLNAGWSDIGSWGSLWDAKIKDQNGNVCESGIESDTYIEDVNNSYIYSSDRLIAAIGVSDLVIIDTKDALLITKKNQSQNIGKVVKKLKIKERSETEVHKKVYRPWGSYDLIESKVGYQVKKIQVNPGSKLSLQKHQYRAEHWIIIKGVAIITCGKNSFKLNENQSTFIPKGELHRLENPGNAVLEIIEIQTGDYLGEDDIIRLEDDYQRD